MKGIIWKALFLFVGCLCVSDIKISASLYDMKDNWVTLHFPQWMDQPIIYFEYGLRQEPVFIFNNPVDSEQIEEITDDSSY